jgi:cell division transport system permease protein
MSALMERGQALTSAARALVRRPATTLLALLVVALAVALPLLIATLAMPLQSLWQRLDAPAQALVFVTSGTGSSEIAALRARLAAQPGIADAAHVPRETALADLAQRAPAGALPNLKSNPLPDAIGITFARGLPATDVEGSVAALRKLERVDAVHFDDAWYRRWRTLAASAQIAAAVASAGLLALALSATLSATLLPAIVGREELRLLALVGATPAFRQRRQAYAGGLIGVAGSALGCAAVAGALAAMTPAAVAMSEAADVPVSWQLLPWPVLLGVVGAVGAIGWITGWVAGRRAAADARP